MRPQSHGNRRRPREAMTQEQYLRMLNRVRSLQLTTYTAADLRLEFPHSHRPLLDRFMSLALSRRHVLDAGEGRFRTAPYQVTQVIKVGTSRLGHRLPPHSDQPVRESKHSVFNRYIDQSLRGGSSDKALHERFLEILPEYLASEDYSVQDALVLGVPQTDLVKVGLL